MFFNFAKKYFNIRLVEMIQEEFFSGVSRLRNQEIKRIFIYLEYIDGLYSRIPYTISKYSIGILMSSVIRYIYWYDKVEESTLNYSEITSKLPQNSPKTTPKPPKNHLKTTSYYHTILVELQKNPFFSRHDLAELSGTTINQVRSYLGNLKKEGVIHDLSCHKKCNIYDCQAIK